MSYCFNFITSNDLTQIVNFLIRIPDCDSHSIALLDLLVSFDSIICSAVLFQLAGNFDHFFVPVSIHFASNPIGDTPFHFAALDYSFVDRDDLHDHLKDFHRRISLVWMLLHLIVNIVNGSRLEMMHIPLS